MITSPKEQLRRHLRFIASSVSLYDAGHHDEALRIAVSLRVLFHHTNASHSLIEQLGASKTLRMLSTFSERPKTSPDEKLALWVDCPLSFDGFEPQLGTSHHNRYLPQHQWWTDVVYTFDQDYSRRDITLAAANKDGGAHVDPRSSHSTENLRAGLGTFTTRGAQGSETIELVNSHFLLLRQFAFEVLSSPDLSALAG